MPSASATMALLSRVPPLHCRSTTTMSLMSVGPRIWPWNKFAKWRWGRTPCVSGCRIPPYKFLMILVGSIQLTSLRRNCGMALIFDAYKIPSCVHCLTFSTVSFGCSSLAPACQAPTTTDSTVHSFFVGIYQQGFVSFGVMLLSAISDPGSYITSLQCRPSYHPVT